VSERASESMSQRLRAEPNASGPDRAQRGSAMSPPIDLTDQDEFQRRVPHDWFTWLRENAPVHWNPEPNGRGFWAITRHQDVVAICKKFDLEIPIDFSQFR